MNGTALRRIGIAPLIIAGGVVIALVPALIGGLGSAIVVGAYDRGAGR